MSIPSVYYWLRVRSTPLEAELDQFRLMELGALGTEEEEHTAVDLRACFDDAALLEAAREAFGEAVLDGGEAPWEDWDRSWRERQTPVEVTEYLTVCPPWVPAPESARNVIKLEAKMAFGTGSHESTRIAALLMEAQELNGRSVMDVGTGTGILAIYAAQRGAAFSVGFDIDPVAGPCLRENIDLNPPRDAENGEDPAFYVGTLDSLKDDALFDVLVINMIRTETWPYLADLLARTAPGGRLVFSGQRVEDQPHWKQWFAETGVSVESEVTLGEWWGFTGKKKAD